MILAGPLALLPLLACTWEPSWRDDGWRPDGGTDSGFDSGTDSGSDGGAPSGTDGGTDSGATTDGGTPDGGTPDGGSTDGGTPVPEGTCSLASTLGAAHLWEGETVHFTVACTGTLATEDAELSAVGLPAGATFDPLSLALVWATGPTDGGRHDLVFSARPAGSTGVPEASTVTLWIADDPTLADAVAVEPAAYTEEWGLPVLHVQTTQPLTTNEQDATVTWYGTEHASRIKIRGATSSGYAKPGYTLDFPKDELPIEAWGVERDHLVLVSPFDDNSYVRQKLVYDQWAAIADYWGAARLTPRTQYVVLYLDGAYHGLYLGLDRIDDEFARQMGFDGEGNLYKAVSHDANFYLTDSGGNPKTTLTEGYEKTEGDPAGDMSDLQALVTFTGGSSVATFADEAGDWLDLEEYMDWFLLVHFALAEDSAGKNAYLYHEPVLDRWLYTPWDFNHAWGQNWYTLRTSSSTINDFDGYNKIFADLQADPDLEAAMWDRFAEMREDGPYSLAWLEGTLDATYAAIDPSARRDWDAWQEEYESAWWAPYREGTWTDYDGEKAYLYHWVRARHALYEELVP